MSDTDTLVTAEEALRISRDEGKFELLTGRIVWMEPPGAEHAAVTVNVGAELHAHVRAHRLGRTYGESGFLIGMDPDTVRAPDAAFVRAERVEAVGRTFRYFPGAPDCAVEVVSPNDTFSEVEAKAYQWIDAGCVAVLVLDPRRFTATVYRSRHDVRSYDGDAVLDLSDAVPGWTVSLPVLFE